MFGAKFRSGDAQNSFLSAIIDFHVGLRFTEHTFDTPVGERTAMVITPTAHVRVNQMRLQELREQAEQVQTLGEIDAEILRQAEMRADHVQLTIFRGRNDENTASWGYSDELTDLQANEISYLMLRGQMLVYRGLIRAGLCLHLHSEWAPVPLDGYRQAIRRRIYELEENEDDPKQSRTPTQDADLWILRNLTFFFSLNFENVVNDLLPEKLPLMERRMERIHKMVLDLPEDAFKYA